MKLWRILYITEVYLSVLSKYLLTTDNDFNPVYDGIRKLNVIDWMLQP